MNECEEAVIHVIDDDDAMRTALTRLLASAGYVVKNYASAGEYLVTEPDPRAGCILLDLELGGPNGLELQQAVARHARALPIVFMSAYSDVPRTVKAMKAGAVDFLMKPFDRQTLLGALHAALDACPARRETSLEAGNSGLGEREKAILRGIVSGMRNKQIAAELRLSERTIKSCRAEIMRKLGVNSLGELLLKADAVTSALSMPTVPEADVAAAAHYALPKAMR